jgi:hypothetical protein
MTEEEPENARGWREGLEAIGNMAEKILEALGDDTTVLSEPHGLLHDLARDLQAQVSRGLFAVDMRHYEIWEEFTVGWRQLLASDLRRHLEQWSDDRLIGIMLGLLTTVETEALPDLEEYLRHPKVIDADIPTPEARKVLTRMRALSTETSGILSLMSRLTPKTEAESLDMERSLLTLTQQHRFFMSIAAQCAELLANRGERVPRWKVPHAF